MNVGSPKEAFGWGLAVHESSARFSACKNRALFGLRICSSRLCACKSPPQPGSPGTQKLAVSAGLWLTARLVRASVEPNRRSSHAEIGE